MPSRRAIDAAGVGVLVCLLIYNHKLLLDCKNTSAAANGFAPGAPPAPIPNGFVPVAAPPAPTGVAYPAAASNALPLHPAPPPAQSCPAQAWATVAEKLGRVPSFPVRCRNDLVTFAEQLGIATGQRGVITSAAGGGKLSSEMTDETWFGGQTLDAAAAAPGVQFDWLHFAGSVNTAADLDSALDRWYAALKPGGL